MNYREILHNNVTQAFKDYYQQYRRFYVVPEIVDGRLQRMVDPPNLEEFIKKRVDDIIPEDLTDYEAKVFSRFVGWSKIFNNKGKNLLDILLDIRHSEESMFEMYDRLFLLRKFVIGYGGRWEFKKEPYEIYNCCEDGLINGSFVFTKPEEKK